MQITINKLIKRRKIMFYVIFTAAIAGLVFDNIFEINTVSYFGDNKILVVYGLISYKLIELTILYYLFYKRHLVSFTDESSATEHSKFEKNAKRFFMLVPHGSIIFGIISYKLTGDISFFLLFLLIASSALFLVDPKRLS